MSARSLPPGTAAATPTAPVLPIAATARPRLPAAARGPMYDPSFYADAIREHFLSESSSSSTSASATSSVPVSATTVGAAGSPVAATADGLFGRSALDTAAGAGDDDNDNDDTEASPCGATTVSVPTGGSSITTGVTARAAAVSASSVLSASFLTSLSSLCARPAPAAASAATGGSTITNSNSSSNSSNSSSISSSVGAGDMRVRERMLARMLKRIDSNGDVNMDPDATALPHSSMGVYGSIRSHALTHSDTHTHTHTHTERVLRGFIPTDSERDSNCDDDDDDDDEDGGSSKSKSKANQYADSEFAPIDPLLLLSSGAVATVAEAEAAVATAAAAAKSKIKRKSKGKNGENKITVVNGALARELVGISTVIDVAADEEEYDREQLQQQLQLQQQGACELLQQADDEQLLLGDGSAATATATLPANVDNVVASSGSVSDSSVKRLPSMLTQFANATANNNTKTPASAYTECVTVEETGEIAIEQWSKADFDSDSEPAGDASASNTGVKTDDNNHTAESEATAVTESAVGIVGQEQTEHSAATHSSNNNESFLPGAAETDSDSHLQTQGTNIASSSNSNDADSADIEEVAVDSAAHERISYSQRAHARAQARAQHSCNSSDTGVIQRNGLFPEVAAAEALGLDAYPDNDGGANESAANAATATALGEEESEVLGAGLTAEEAVTRWAGGAGAGPLTQIKLAGDENEAEEEDDEAFLDSLFKMG